MSIASRLIRQRIIDQAVMEGAIDCDECFGDNPNCSNCGGDGFLVDDWADDPDEDEIEKRRAA